MSEEPKELHEEDADDLHDPKETAIAFAGVALIAETLDCPIIKMDIKTERLPEGALCTSGVYATGGVPLYNVEAAPPRERETLEALNNSIRARTAAQLGLAGDVAYWIYMGDPDPDAALQEESETLQRAREEVARYVDDLEEYLRGEALLAWEQIRRHWKAVDTLADALLKHESLSGERIRALLKEKLERERKPRVRRSRPEPPRRHNSALSP